MSDITIKVLEPPESNDLMSLADAKIMLGIADTDTTNDDQLALAISQNSISISSLALRRGYGFGKQKVRETHRCVPPQCCPDGAIRVWLMLWPVKEEDIESVEGGGTYELEEQSGKLTIWGGGSTIVVTYSGGYLLPDEAPLDLQQACKIQVSQARTEAAAAAVTGIRMISHKSARVMFHSPTQSAGGGSSGGAGATSGAAKAVQALLVPYTRYVI